MALATLMTDFGGRDAFVGILKGVILGRCPEARLVDLCHDLEPGDRRGAALQLRSALPYFPAGTVHVVVVDPGVGSERAVVAARCGEQTILAPDNGLLAPLGDRLTAIHRIERPDLHLEQVSGTFHGRDVFAPVAAALLQGAALEDLGPSTLLLEDPDLWPVPRWDAAGAHGEVLHVDRFGNLITNIEQAEVQAMPDTHVCLGERDIGAVRRCYADGRAREPVAVWNSWNLLEIAVRDGNAAHALEARRGAPVLLAAALRRATQNKK